MYVLRDINIAFLIFLTACNGQSDEPLVFAGQTMGTQYSITIPVAGNLASSVNKSEIDAILDSINRKMSTYISDSELSRINRSDSTDWQPISDELYSVLQTALAISEETEGAFDITIGGVVNLWGFGPGPGLQHIPDTFALEQALEISGFQHISLKTMPNAIKKDHAGIYLDLSGIAKGYAVDRIAGYLEGKNIEHYLVDIGGELRARGQNRLAQTWRIGIEKPLIDTREVGQVIGLEDTGMATSGDYRNFFIADGKHYSHTIDPATGRPVAHGVTSVTVLDHSTMVADALATALLVMGPDKGYRFAEGRGLPALFIIETDEGFTEQNTSAFIPYLEN